MAAAGAAAEVPTPAVFAAWAWWCCRSPRARGAGAELGRREGGLRQEEGLVEPRAGGEEDEDPRHVPARPTLPGKLPSCFKDGAWTEEDEVWGGLGRSLRRRKDPWSKSHARPAAGMHSNTPPRSDYISWPVSVLL